MDTAAHSLELLQSGPRLLQGAAGDMEVIFEVAGQRYYDTPANVPGALVVHGESDERVPLASVFEWARPQAQPVVVVPGADHFFTGRLHILRALVLSHFAG